MAASETPIAGANVLFSIGGTQVGGQTGATFTHTAGAIELAKKGQGLWGDELDGEHEVQVSLPAVQTESDGTHTVGADGNAKLELDDGGGLQTVPGLDELTVSLSNEFDDIAGLDDPLWRLISVDGKDMELSFTGDWYDPVSTAGATYGMIHDLIDPAVATDSLDFTATFGSTTVSGTVRADDLEIDAPGPGEGNVQASVTMGQIGAVTIGGTAIDTGLQAILDAYINNTVATLLLEQLDDSGTAVSGATQLTGDAYISDLELTASRAEELQISTDFQSNGAWTTPTAV